MEINFQVNTVCVTLFSQTPQTLCIYYSINMKASHFWSHFFPKNENGTIKGCYATKDVSGCFKQGD